MIMGDVETDREVVEQPVRFENLDASVVFSMTVSGILVVPVTRHWILSRLQDRGNLDQILLFCGVMGLTCGAIGLLKKFGFRQLV
jgi:hypothetical protein